MRATKDTDDNSWLEGGAVNSIGADEVDPTAKGFLLSKSRLAECLGVAVKTVDRWIKEGGPVISRGTTRQGWKINSAAFITWLRDYDVRLAVGDDDHLSFEKAKAREKEAQAKLKEDELETRRGKMVSIDDAVSVYEEEVLKLKTRMLAIPSRASTDPLVQAAVRLEVLDALNELAGGIAAQRTDDEEPESEQQDFDDVDGDPDAVKVPVPK